ncbi:MAG: uracil-DNA glycosylase [Candidatus Lloydbacteria bacterium RIFCSPHIGHO2_02_FULL_54_17]|uniref:Uracil-DNA glycosylase n=1 Tax=Candidatus Lloydbacteria bacterium RIFCSPHIGHO2_02_FULL_54_17 TaxID=1798664 RepID=A0A1G2DFA3_9BACT|nr:MAG: uracil-DNA glycosylase [Candidatus Lloydbacteria bacterium RIFCSPHIGHO2_01_FULL_54_11]OGZ12315.1 MAG: uracil-DNA glycosylase [Candidatus Lloydbacteria bacterium RIFCSPHIGHO2_02_FULL_54_17]OGZ14591.1 MAG: uracil-DNA glycosylase [Candidatus Lloydbacteria bacterium RIFCSPLOWO2_01_FULL_54_18]OGZ16321.1 MAG: uracil-DNA glycosylase [Candidatus Lloydbacteria bacterium RIFCSPLOWO2_02_FULL_54_12]
MDKDQKVKIAPAWEPLLQEEFAQAYFRELREKVRMAYLKDRVFPHPSRMFRAFELCAPKDVRVVILGQDPYHTPGVADGLAFSSFFKNPVPPSLENIYNEIEAEFGCVCPRTPELTHWAEQGVLLLNASLTVLAGRANSHADLGWHEFTDAVIGVVSRECDHVVFLLWGNYARQKRPLIDASKHLVLESPHPSPLSAHKGFFGNDHFKKANEYLEKNGRKSIDWC